MSDPFDVSEFAKAAAYASDPQGADRGLYVRFYNDEMKDERASSEMGRPIFKSVEMCEIRFGDRNNVIVVLTFAQRERYGHRPISRPLPSPTRWQ